MLIQTSYLLAMIDVPDLSLTIVCADGQMIAFITPADACNLVIAHNFTQFLNLGSTSTPNVYGFVKTNCEHVGGAPINQIQVKVVLQLRSVQNFVRHLINPTWFAKVKVTIWIA
jgi:hypothetical protein